MIALFAALLLLPYLDPSRNGAAPMQPTIVGKFSLSPRGLLRAVKKYGITIASIYPPAAAIIGPMMAVAKAADKGHKASQDKLDATKTKAAAGDPQAKMDFAAYLSARDIIEKEKSKTSTAIVGRGFLKKAAKGAWNVTKQASGIPAAVALTKAVATGNPKNIVKAIAKGALPPGASQTYNALRKKGSSPKAATQAVAARALLQTNAEERKIAAEVVQQQAQQQAEQAQPYQDTYQPAAFDPGDCSDSEQPDPFDELEEQVDPFDNLDQEEE